MVGLTIFRKKKKKIKNRELEGILMAKRAAAKIVNSAAGLLAQVYYCLLGNPLSDRRSIVYKIARSLARSQSVYSD